ncbi:DegQ family serine endoprotease [Rhabdaerophilum sp. SD176]|uniref:DegQ family serine endoprotease n=1 Tax=Rhabdaerophilum sp. SD176 TaxID=2983548 RepID=UPI0024E00D6C|nr:DegQ family serine endoprotease [Rhabdaerophilum sp. SD176]
MMSARTCHRGLVLGLLMSLVGLVAPVLAQAPREVRPPVNRAEVTLSFAPIVRSAAPAVVNIYASQKQNRARNPFEGDPFFERFFGGLAQPDRARQSVGSGVILGRDGMVVTNHHVIEGMTEIKVALPDRREFEAEIKLRDPKTDLAVLQIKGGGTFPALELGDSEALEVGDFVLAIGNPFGVGQTVTQGIVSALARTQVGISDYQFFIQTDAAINPGNSGGALVDMQGRVIGINTAIYSKSGGSHGIGFAIPANMVRSVLDSARSGGGVVRRPWLGASLQVITSELAETLSLPRPVGALVSGVTTGSPADQAGLKRLDVIQAVDGVEIDDPDAFGFRFATKALGGTMRLTVLRGGRKQDLTLRLVPAPEIPARNATLIKSNSPFQGATVVNISPAVKEEFSISGIDSGVAISEVEPGSSAEQVGFRKGDVILTLNGQRIEDTGAMDRATRGRSYLWRITFNRGGQTFSTAFGG